MPDLSESRNLTIDDFWLLTKPPRNPTPKELVAVFVRTIRHVAETELNRPDLAVWAERIEQELHGRELCGTQLEAVPDFDKGA